MPSVPFLESALPLSLVRRGKVRDIYELGDNLLLVTSDRISAFDWVLPTGIPDKGRVLTGLSAFWFEWCEALGVNNHFITADVAAMPLPKGIDTEALEGRTMLVKKATVVPIECVVRGYLAGSSLKEYQKTGEVCGIPLPPGLRESQELPEPIFTPATKEESGHDINISFAQMCERVGEELSEELRAESILLYQRGALLARRCGIIIADTKFEWGFDANAREAMLIDEVLTPDSSRFWSADQYQPGKPQPSFDKQFVRDWLEKESGWTKDCRPPALPEEIVAITRAKYIEAFERITRLRFKWKVKCS